MHNKIPPAATTGRGRHPKRGSGNFAKMLGLGVVPPGTCTAQDLEICSGKP